MPKRDYRSLLLRIVSGAGALWMTFTIYLFFFAVDSRQFGFLAPDVANRLDACSGSGREYYDCVDRAIIHKGQIVFFDWVKEVCLIIGPPLLLWLLVKWALRPRSSDEPDDFIPPPQPIKRWQLW